MTYKLGSVSLARMEGVHPDLVKVVKAAILRSPQDFCVQEGLRSLEQQHKNVAAGNSRTMASKHLRQSDGYAHAVDLVPWVDGHAQWLWGEPGDHDKSGQRVGGCYWIAVAMRLAALDLHVPLRWGGVWDRALAALPDTRDGMRDAVTAYRVRHVGSDLLDGPHFELA